MDIDVGNTFVMALREVTETMLRRLQVSPPAYLAGKEPRPWDINNGRCEEFAESVAARVPGATATPAYDPELHPTREDGGWDCDHFVVEFAGRFYDAECHSGVERVRDLPIYRHRGQSRSVVVGAIK
jgi:hypothetical protein